MARYTGRVCALCRRENVKLFLKGSRCFGAKCAFERRPSIPGQFGNVRGRGRMMKQSGYGLQLREKQKCRRIYMVLERQFRGYVKRALQMRGVTGTNLLQLLERRLDNCVYRMGFASSRRQARQLVRHGHFLVDGRRVDIPSYLVKPEQAVEVREQSRGMIAIKEAISVSESTGLPPWLSRDTDAFRASLNRLPEPEEIAIPVDAQSIVELYSR